MGSRDGAMAAGLLLGFTLWNCYFLLATPLSTAGVLVLLQGQVGTASSRSRGSQVFSLASQSRKGAQ